jgi:hypothetical protein
LELAALANHHFIQVEMSDQIPRGLSMEVQPNLLLKVVEEEEVVIVELVMEAAVAVLTTPATPLLSVTQYKATNQAIVEHMVLDLMVAKAEADFLVILRAAEAALVASVLMPQILIQETEEQEKKYRILHQKERVASSLQAEGAEELVTTLVQVRQV